MKRFHDQQGREWTAAVATGSFGATTLMFAMAGDSRLWWQPFEAENAAQAEELLVGLSADDLRTRLADAHYWAADTDTNSGSE